MLCSPQCQLGLGSHLAYIGFKLRQAYMLKISAPKPNSLPATLEITRDIFSKLPYTVYKPGVERGEESDFR